MEIATPKNSQAQNPHTSKAHIHVKRKAKMDLAWSTENIYKESFPKA